MSFMTRKSRIKRAIFFTVIIILVLVLIVSAMVFIPRLLMKNSDKRFSFTKETLVKIEGADRIHFLDTGYSDCIIIESNGHFAIIDGAEDSENPRKLPELELKGYEKEVVSYIKKIAADENGKVVIDWILGTHCHSDHIGGFDTIVLDPDITVKKAYLNLYIELFISLKEIEEWDNKEVYTRMTDACKSRDVEIVSDIPSDEWKFEDFSVQFFNTLPNRKIRVGENENSIGTKLTVGSNSIFLAADMNNIENAEKTVAPLVGDVDMLKVAHHGYARSSSPGFINKLDPEISIITNDRLDIRTVPPLIFLTMLADSSVYTTVNHNGIIADFTSGKDIILTDNIM